MMKQTKQLLFIAILSIFAILITGCSEKIETNMSEKMIDFSFTTQDEQTLSLDDLKGNWWVTYFSYTDCRTVCPRTTANMVRLQKELKALNLTPKIVSFSVDPENDTPEVLINYAEENDVDLASWDFVTGYDFEAIQNFSEKSFKAVLESGAIDQRAHSFMFYLINPKGDVVKKYDGMSQNEVDLLIEDLQVVL